MIFKTKLRYCYTTCKCQLWYVFPSDSGTEPAVGTSSTSRGCPKNRWSLKAHRDMVRGIQSYWRNRISPISSSTENILLAIIGLLVFRGLFWGILSAHHLFSSALGEGRCLHARITQTKSHGWFWLEYNEPRATATPRRPSEYFGGYLGSWRNYVLRAAFIGGYCRVWQKYPTRKGLPIWFTKGG